MATPLFATCLGLACPVGLTPESAAAAMRAGIDGFGELAYLDDEGEPIVGAMVPELTPELCGRSRLVALLGHGLAGIQERVPPSLALEELPLLFCTREPVRPGAAVNGVLAEVEAQLGLAFRRDESGHLARGSVAAFEALDHARRLFAAGKAEACLIVAADTLIDARSLRWLAHADRLRRPVQPDGVAPGEAAGVLLVTVSPFMPSRVGVQGLGFARETATVLNEEPLLGRGMAAAVRQALAEAGHAMHEIDLRLSDVAGESYAFEELALAQSRLMRQTREAQVLWHPAAFMGDVGAAAAIVQLAWIEQAFARGYTPGWLALCHGSAASGSRAAAVVGR